MYVHGHSALRERESPHASGQWQFRISTFSDGFLARWATSYTAALGMSQEWTFQHICVYICMVQAWSKRSEFGASH